jgi:hypothetical protein
MSKTAVGLFQNSALAEVVARDLVTSGFPKNEVRTLREPVDMGGAGLMSSPHTDFEVGLERELTAIGATVREANAYARGTRRGGAIVFATGSATEVADATELMNNSGALEVEELIGEEPWPIVIEQDIPSVPDGPQQAGRIRESGSGARVFVW